MQPVQARLELVCRLYETTMWIGNPKPGDQHGHRMHRQRFLTGSDHPRTPASKSVKMCQKATCWEQCALLAFTGQNPCQMRKIGDQLHQLLNTMVREECVCEHFESMLPCRARGSIVASLPRFRELFCSLILCEPWLQNGPKPRRRLRI